jgi:predicted nucleic acid-binding protein
MVPRIHLDANVFIVAFESGGEIADALKQVFRLIESQNVEAFASNLTLAEVLVGPYRDRADRRSLKLPDAIHLATAELCDCGILVSNDGDVVTRAPMSRVGFAANELAESIEFLQ